MSVIASEQFKSHLTSLIQMTNILTAFQAFTDLLDAETNQSARMGQSSVHALATSCLELAAGKQGQRAELAAGKNKKYSSIPCRYTIESVTVDIFCAMNSSEIRMRSSFCSSEYLWLSNVSMSLS